MLAMARPPLWLSLPEEIPITGLPLWFQTEFNISLKSQGFSSRGQERSWLTMQQGFCQG